MMNNELLINTIIAVLNENFARIIERSHNLQADCIPYQIKRSMNAHTDVNGFRIPVDIIEMRYNCDAELLVRSEFLMIFPNTYTNTVKIQSYYTYGLRLDGHLRTSVTLELYDSNFIADFIATVQSAIDFVDRIYGRAKV